MDRNKIVQEILKIDNAKEIRNLVDLVLQEEEFSEDEMIDILISSILETKKD